MHGGNRHYHPVRRYGISAAEADDMAHSQAHRSPICRPAAYLRGDLTAPRRTAPGVYDVAGTAWRRKERDDLAG